MFTITLRNSRLELSKPPWIPLVGAADINRIPRFRIPRFLHSRIFTTNQPRTRTMSGLVRYRTRTFVLAEETANQLTHGLGLLLSIGGAVVLVSSAKAHSDPLQLIGCCVYAASLVALYTASTLSHRA